MSMTSRILCLETATDICSVAVSIDGRVVAIKEAQRPFAHASQITVLIAECMAEAGLKMSDLSAVAVSSGPGSYTALRVGFSCAKGICTGLSVPLIGVATLKALAMAASLQVEATYYAPMIDARRMEVYTALYDNQGSLVLPARAMILGPDSFCEFFDQGTVAFIGNGASKYEQVISTPDLSLFPSIRCSAHHLAIPAQEAWHKQTFQNLAYFSPYYLKPPNITQPKKKF